MIIDPDFEFGCAALPSTTAPSLRGIVECAADAGYDRFWIPDQEFGPDPFLILDDLASRTPIELALAITNPFSRHPVQIARAMASLVQLHDPARKWILGLGKGNTNLVLGPMGVANQANTTRLIDAIAVVKSLLRGEPIGPDQSSFVADELRLGIEPVSCSVYLGTRGPKTMRACATVADGLIAEALFQPDLIDWVKNQVSSERDGGSPSPHVAWQAVIILEDEEPIPDHARKFAAMLLRTTAPEALDVCNISAPTRAGIAEGILDSTRLPDEDVRRVVAIGTPNDLQHTILAAHAAGITSWASMFLGDQEIVAAQLLRFAREVITPLRTQPQPERRNA